MESLNLTPAESLMIISPKSNGGEMIKLTLMDLLLKRVLRISMEEHESKYLKRHYNATVIGEGESSELILKPHEEILNDLVLEHHELELKELAKLLYKRVSSSEYKNKYIRDPLLDRGYFKKQKKMLLALVPYTTYALTDEGLEVRSKMMKLLDDAENLEKWMKEDLGRAKACLSVLGSHMLLTNTYDIADIKKFNRILSNIKPEAPTSDYYTYYLYSMPLDYLDDYGNLQSFDFLDISLFDNFDSFDDFFSDFDAGSGDGGGGSD